VGTMSPRSTDLTFFHTLICLTSYTLFLCLLRLGLRFRSSRRNRLRRRSVPVLSFARIAEEAKSPHRTSTLVLARLVPMLSGSLQATARKHLDERLAQAPLFTLHECSNSASPELTRAALRCVEHRDRDLGPLAPMPIVVVREKETTPNTIPTSPSTEETSNLFGDREEGIGTPQSD
jgi:hypothetical protein